MPDVAQKVMGLNRLLLLPSVYAIANQLPNIILGFLLLISARGVANQVIRAYKSTILVLVLVVIYTLISYQYIAPVIFVTVLLIAFILSKKTLYRQQFIHSWEQQVVGWYDLGDLNCKLPIIRCYSCTVCPKPFS